jgi:predicted hydrolase (HD superfamily)
MFLNAGYNDALTTCNFVPYHACIYDRILNSDQLKKISNITNRSRHKFFLYLLYQYTKKEDLLPHILKSDIIIYDIISRPDQVDEATWAVSGV